MTTYTYQNPSFRVYQIDKDTNVVLDYDQYRLDLDKANREDLPTITFDKTYSAKEKYSLDNLSHASIFRMA